MIKLEKVDVMNIENAIRGMRNPLNSWGKSDSFICEWYESEDVCSTCTYNRENSEECPELTFVIGHSDLDLAQRLCKAGSDHRKFLRQIFVSVDVTAPLYWWKEYDTYKVGTTANSTSTMHKIHSRALEFEDFSLEQLEPYAMYSFKTVLSCINELRVQYVETKDKKYWYSIIQLLPSSYNQMRTCTMTYENLRSMYAARKNHKLAEWHGFCEWVESLPYAGELIIE